MNNIAIFASGSGTNAENLVHYFSEKGKLDQGDEQSDHPVAKAQIHKPIAKVALIVTNRKEAGVVERAHRLQVPLHYVSKKDFEDPKKFLDLLKQYKIDWVVLAGFLWLIPHYLIKAFPEKILNIHPSLLPKYGGKGMYGMHVHEAVIKNGESVSGITIHKVNEEFDEGPIVFQAACPIDPEDAPEDLAAKIHQLEYKHFPKIIEEVIERELRQNEEAT